MTTNMKSNRGGFTGLEIVGAIAVVGLVVSLVVPPPKGGQAAWYSFRSWGKHKPADNFDKAKTLVDANSIRFDAKLDDVVHVAAIEVNKAQQAIPSLPPSPATDVVRRTVGNAAAALNQASPVTAAEEQENVRIIAGLLSTEAAARAKAETAQQQAEAALTKTSQELEQLRRQQEDLQAKLKKAGDDLRTGFEERNALANELEAQRARRVWFYVVIGFLLLAVVYAKVALAGVGRALDRVDDGTFKRVATEVNTELGAVGQWAIRTGRVGAAKVRAAREAIAKAHQPEAPAS